VPNILELLKIVPVFVAAILIGNWFLAELKKAYTRGEPWYTPYFSPPGLLILVALSLPIIIWIIKR